MNPTDTNQASEDELDAILAGYFTWKGEAIHEIHATQNYKRMKAAILSLIRTEKLKLLAEVRERVVGENIKWNHTERMQYSTRETDAFDYMFAVNSTKDEQREQLTKLEAEL